MFLLVGTCFREVGLTVRYYNEPLITSANKIGQPVVRFPDNWANSIFCAWEAKMQPQRCLTE